MTTRHDSDERLDEVLAEIERARRTPAWTPEPERTPRRLLRAPGPLEDARWTPSRTAVVLVLLCALLAFVIFGIRMMLVPDRAAQRPSPSASALQVAGRATVASDRAPATSGASASASSAASATSGGVLNVHVVGAVGSPGVVRVPPGSRVADAVRAAGGLRGADAAGVNLARALADGEQVYVPRPGEGARAEPPAAGAGGSGPAGSGQGGATPPEPRAPGASVNLNTADATALDSLPGVGPVLAQRIIDWRTEHGKFSSVDELGEVSGIGEKAMDRLRSKVTV